MSISFHLSHYITKICILDFFSKNWLLTTTTKLLYRKVHHNFFYHCWHGTIQNEGKDFAHTNGTNGVFFSSWTFYSFGWPQRPRNNLVLSELIEILKRKLLLNEHTPSSGLTLLISLKHRAMLSTQSPFDFM